MTKQELLTGLTDLFAGLPDDARIDVRVQCGVEESEGPICMEGKDNGTRTITIKVNGGAHDTEGEPYYYKNFSQEDRAALRRINARFPSTHPKYSAKPQ